MKMRKGFVSNSSSTSYIVFIKDPEEIVIKDMEELLKIIGSHDIQYLREMNEEITFPIRAGLFGYPISDDEANDIIEVDFNRVYTLSKTYPNCKITQKQLKRHLSNEYDKLMNDGYIPHKIEGNSNTEWGLIALLAMSIYPGKGAITISD